MDPGHVTANGGGHSEPDRAPGPVFGVVRAQAPTNDPLGAITPAAYRRLRAYARRILYERLGWSAARADGDDVVQDALEAVLRRLGRRGGEVNWTFLYGAVRLQVGHAVRSAGREINMHQTGAIRDTGCFPNQIFGCRLADAFDGPEKR